MDPIILPEPRKRGGKTLLETLSLRQTNRSIGPREIPMQVLSNLLWAAFGVNREKASFRKKGRTAPSASNSQEIDLYVALKDGLYLYEAGPHQLTPISTGDFSMLSGQGGASRLTQHTPVNIFYVGPDLRDHGRARAPAARGAGAALRRRLRARQVRVALGR